MAGGILLVFAVIPGFPFFIFALLASLVASPAFFIYRKKKKMGLSQSTDLIEGESENEMKPGAVPLLLHCAANLKPASFKSKVDALRLRLFEQLGLPVPDVIVRTSHQLENNGLSISVYQERVLQLVLPENELLIGHPHPELTVRRQNLSRRMGEIYWISSEQKSQAKSLWVSLFLKDTIVLSTV